MLSLRRAVFRLIVISLAVGAIVACGGKSDSKDSSAKLDTGRAAQIAHTALLDPSALSGAWVNFSTDNFRNDDASLPDSEACKPARTLASDMSKADLNRAQRALQIELQGYSSKGQIEMHVRVYDTAATAMAFLKRHRQNMTGDTYIRCLQDGFSQLFGPNARVRFGDARGKAPRDGVASAFDQDLKVEDTVFQLHTDSYAWVQESVYVLVLISSPRDLDSRDFVKEALEKVQANVDTALKLAK